MTKVNNISHFNAQTSGPLAHKIKFSWTFLLILGSFIYPHFMDKTMSIADI